MAIGQTLRAKWRAFSYYAGGRPRAQALLRWAVWGIRCLLRLPAIVTIARYGMRLYLAPRWKGCWKAVFVFRDRFFEISDPELGFLERSLQPGDVFVDAGAFHGWYALVASRVVGERGHVLAFEPNPDTFAVLSRNVALNGCRNLQAFSLALSDSDDTVYLYKGPNDGSTSSLARIPEDLGQEQVAARRLDGILEELKIPHVDLMKIDIQGGEANLIRGAFTMLQTSRPVVIFELAPDLARDMGGSEADAWDLLASLGYRFFRLSASALEPLVAFPTLAEGAFFNVVAIPDGRRSQGATG